MSTQTPNIKINEIELISFSTGNQQQYKLGIFTFKASLSREKIKQIVSKDLNKYALTFPSYRLTNTELSNIFQMLPHCEKWEVSMLKYPIQKLAQIPPQIVNIRFDNLFSLDLSEHKIQSIENICNLWIPNLETLKINNNHICEIKSLRRAYFPKLSKIYIGNAIESRHYSELNCPNLKLMHIFDTNHLLNTEKVQIKFMGFAWLAKLQTTKLTQFIEHNVLPPQVQQLGEGFLRVNRCLQKKYKRIHINVN